MWILLALLLIGLLPIGSILADRRQSSLRSRFRADVSRELARPARPQDVVTDGDLLRLPPPVARYLRRGGVVGKPRVYNFHAVFRARIRGGPDEPWMPARAEQYAFFDPAVRLFFMKARRRGVPIHVNHRFTPDSATMRGRILGLFTVLDVAGPEMVQGETVTLLNDMFLLAPATLVDAPIQWQVLDDRMVRATFTNAGTTVSAVVNFDEAGDLVDFVSDDRYRIDGESKRLRRWSTPVTRYGKFGGRRLFAQAVARWTEPSGEEWDYVWLALERIEYNVHRRS